MDPNVPNTPTADQAQTDNNVAQPQNNAADTSVNNTPTTADPNSVTPPTADNQGQPTSTPDNTQPDNATPAQPTDNPTPPADPNQATNPTDGSPVNNQPQQPPVGAQEDNSSELVDPSVQDVSVEGKPEQVPQNNAQLYAHTMPGDAVAQQVDGSPVIPVPAKPTDALTITDGQYNRPIASSDVLESYGLIEYRDPETGMMRQMTKEDAQNRIQELKNLESQLGGNQ